tara:strand:+ start:43 stop:477 length:435 start_codon:yes stop_codon:yes gene_type:complete
MDRSRYLAEIASDAESIVTNAALDAADLNCGIDLTSSESSEISRISDSTVRSGNWAEYTLIHSRNVTACDEHDPISASLGAREAITHIAFWAYRADLIKAVSEYSDDEIAEVYGWCRCEKCDDWNEDEDEAAECCFEEEEDGEE